MGCDIHCVMQKRNKDGQWETFLYDVFPARNYTFYNFLSGIRGYAQGIATEGFPEGFHLEEGNKHGGYWMGDHSFGWVGLEDLISAPLPNKDVGRKFEITQNDYGFTVEFRDPENEYYGDGYDLVEAIQRGVSALFGPYVDFNDYRLVFGYDS